MQQQCLIQLSLILKKKVSHNDVLLCIAGVSYVATWRDISDILSCLHNITLRNVAIITIPKMFELCNIVI